MARYFWPTEAEIWGSLPIEEQVDLTMDTELVRLAVGHGEREDDDPA